MKKVLEDKNITKIYKVYKSNFDRIKEIFTNKIYHREFISNQDITFDLFEKETLGIIGVNGAGKSTILKIISGVTTPSSGEVLRHGRVTALLELGTGSGAIILALASMRPNHIFFASDRSIKAVEVAKQNAEHHGLDTIINFFCANWFKPLKREKSEPFDMIISNPPYVPSRVIGQLEPEIFAYEPISAIDGDDDGLDCSKHIIENAHRHLNRQGSLLLEIGHDQKHAVQRIIDTCTMYEQVVFLKDYSGHNRVVGMQKKAS